MNATTLFDRSAAAAGRNDRRQAVGAHVTDEVDRDDALNGLIFFSGGRALSAAEFSTVLPAHRAPRHVIVTGLGRSGTTAIAMVVQRLGFTTDRVNDFLESIPLRECVKRKDAGAVLAALQAWDEGTQRRLWKEPKLMSIASMRAMLPRIPESVGFVFVFRDHLNVALRNDAFRSTGPFEALLMAEENNRIMLQTIAGLRNRTMALVSYEKLLTRTHAVTAGLAAFLGLNDGQLIRESTAVVEANAMAYRRSFQLSRDMFRNSRRQNTIVANQ